MNIQNMTDDEKRVNIALVCGAKWCQESGRRFLCMPGGDIMDTTMDNPRRFYSNFAAGDEPILQKGFGEGLLFTIPTPDYLNSLDAMHEAEKTLTRDQCHQFNEVLLEIVRDQAPLCCQCESGAPWSSRWTWHATARHRADAFLLTLP